MISDEKPCSQCFNKGLFLSKRHTSWVVAILLLLGFFIFISGYFLGKKKAAHLFSQQVHDEALADHVYSSMLGLYDLEVSQDDAKTTELDSSEQSEVLYSELKPKDTEIKQVAVEEEENLQTERYYAQLIGFGTYKAAQKFTQKLQKRDIPVTINSRRSKTARGKTITWYQVITEEFTDKEQLIELVDSLKETEKLHDVHIITC